MLLYSAQQIRDQEQLWSRQHKQPTYQLMQRAGRAALLHIQHHFGYTKSITIVCGCGNNAGDGYQLAALALQSGIKVQLLQVGKTPNPNSDAAMAIDYFHQAGGKAIAFRPQLLEGTDLIVDAILGSGIQGEVRAIFAEAIQAINQVQRPVLALDIPSGLSADSGDILGCCVRASQTLSFVGCKRGMVTADGKDVCGKIFVNDLGCDIAFDVNYASIATQDWLGLATRLIPRKHNSHKGSFGRVLCIGGNQHLGGAMLLTTEAALRCGAGYVYSFCHQQHLQALISRVPETIVHSDFDWLRDNIHTMDSIVIGPGLGQDGWAQQALTIALDSAKPLVLDADALNLLAKFNLPLRPGHVLTPHPGEAQRLLREQWPEKDRFIQLQALAQKFQGCALLLKGAGSLLTDGVQTYVETGGNPGMASAGMGDVLSGMVGAFIAQGYEAFLALRLAVALHAYIGDQLAKCGQIGLVASDISKNIRQYLP